MTNADRSQMLVDSAWLMARLDDPRIRIVDCDVPDMYRRAHVPGAVNYVDQMYKNPEDRRFIQTPPQFAETIASLGIGDDTEVVAYDASGSLYSGRLWWCLTYYGHPNVHVVDGGWNVWLAENRPATMTVPKVERATFTPRPDESMYASAEYIMSILGNPGVVVLDVRSDGEWEGTNLRDNKRGGHMPGAVHLEWLNNLTPDAARRIKPAAELRAMFEQAGVTPDNEIVTVCQGGIRAAQAAYTLSLLGYDRVRNYDGSFRDWGNRDDTPLVKD